MTTQRKQHRMIVSEEDEHGAYDPSGLLSLINARSGIGLKTAVSGRSYRKSCHHSRLMGNRA